MPTYDYVCDDCGHDFELFQQMTDPVKRKCPKCGTLKLRRLVGTGAGVIFRGSGFYETDYRSDSYKKGKEAEKKKKDDGGKDGKKKDTSGSGSSESGGSASGSSKSDGSASKSDSSGGSKGRSSESPR